MSTETYIIISLVVFLFGSVLFKHNLCPLVAGLVVSAIGLGSIVPTTLEFFSCILLAAILVLINKKLLYKSDSLAFLFLSVFNSLYYLLGEASIMTYVVLILYYILLIEIKNILHKKNSYETILVALNVFICGALLFFSLGNDIYHTTLAMLVLCILNSNVFQDIKYKKTSLEFFVLTALVPISMLKLISTSSFISLDTPVFYIFSFVIFILFILKDWLSADLEKRNYHIFSFNLFLIYIFAFNFDFLSFYFFASMQIVNVLTYLLAPTILPTKEKSYSALLLGSLPVIGMLLVGHKYGEMIIQSYSDSFLILYLGLIFIPFVMYLSMGKGRVHEI